MCNFQELSLKGKKGPFSSFLLPAGWDAHIMVGTGTVICTTNWQAHVEADSKKLKPAQAPDTWIAGPAPDYLTPYFLNVGETL